MLVSASALGYYGDRGDTWLSEADAPADDFLGRLSVEWEGAAAPAREAGIRVVHPRIGIVLSPAGGALAKMLPPFKAGLGGVVGPGTQYFSWIALDDLVGVIQHVLDRGDLEGPVNAVAPSPVTNAELTQTLGRVLGRPAVLPCPRSRCGSRSARWPRRCSRARACARSGCSPPATGSASRSSRARCATRSEPRSPLARKEK